MEEAIEEVRTLPPEEQQQLRELTASFGELFLMAVVFAFFSKELGKPNLSEMRSLLVEFKTDISPANLAMQSQRALRASQIRGKYRDVLTSSEEFIARKAAEIAKEDRAR
ncbi:MAG: hypothetical protein WBP93_15870 [Pyrinomonadaceae bacterium]